MLNENSSNKFTYKLSWQFPVQESFFDTALSLRKKLFSFLRIIGGENITAIQFANCDGEIINMHTLKNPKVFGVEFATKRTIQHITKVLKKDQRIYYVILIRE